MKINTYTFRTVFTSAAELPVFSGATLRGSFGQSLKQICTNRTVKSCKGCISLLNCAYAAVFESGALSLVKVNQVTSLPPYIIVPPLKPKTAFTAGDEFIFQIKLFGDSFQFFPSIRQAIVTMGQNGIGRKCNSGAGKFQVVDIAHELLDIELESNSSKAYNRLVVHFISPTRIQQKNEVMTFRDEIPFVTLTRAILRRYSALEDGFGNGAERLDYRGLVSHAENITIQASDSRWFDISRYSSRQQRQRKMGGVVGSIEYNGGGLERYLPLLNYCQETHLGKQTSFGFGKFAVTHAGSN